MVFSSTPNFREIEEYDFLTFESRGEVALLSSISLMILMSSLSIFRISIANYGHINEILSQTVTVIQHRKIRNKMATERYE